MLGWYCDTFGNPATWDPIRSLNLAPIYVVKISLENILIYLGVKKSDQVGSQVAEYPIYINWTVIHTLYLSKGTRK